MSFNYDLCICVWICMNRDGQFETNPFIPDSKWMFVRNQNRMDGQQQKHNTAVSAGAQKQWNINQ